MKKEKYNVAVAGATGAVGNEMVSILEERNFPVDHLKLLASTRGAGTQMEFQEKSYTVEVLGENSFAGMDIGLFSPGGSVSQKFAPIAGKAGCVVIDNTSAFRMDPEVPLVVPEINPEDIKKHKGIIANPNCSTIQMVVALFPLHKVNTIKRITVATYQSVSGTGLAAVDELTSQSRLVLEGKKATPKVYPYQIAFNVLPEIDVFLENGYTKEEWKMVEETHKIMHAPEIAISATCVRVPVKIGHSEAVQVEFSRPMSPDEARSILSKAPGVTVVDDPSKRAYPYPEMAAGQDAVYVGRIRKDASHPNGLVLWVVSDNIRKGAALNAVQIAERLVGK